MFLSMFGQEVLNELLLFGGGSVDRRVHRLGWTPWLWSDNEDNRPQCGKGQDVRLHGSTEDCVSSTHC